MNAGNQKCEILKCLRKQIAERYHLVYTPSECKHEGDCAGTCSMCDAELQDLQLQLTEMGKNEIDLYDDIIELLEEMELAEEEDWEEGIIQQGESVPNYDDELIYRAEEGIPAPPYSN